MKHVSYIKARDARPLVTTLLALAVIGIAVGSVYQAVRSPGSSAKIHQYFAPVYRGTDLFEYMCRGFGISVLFLTAAFIMGFFALGQPVCCFLMVARGFGIGASGTMMYALHSTKAVMGMLLFVLPKAVLSVLICVLGFREAMKASSYTLSGWTPEGFTEHRKTDFKLYCIKFFVLIILSLIISAVDAAINFVFVG